MNIKVDDSISMVPLDDQHAEPVFQLVSANRQQLREWLPWVDNMESVDFIKNFIRDSKKRWEEKSDYAFVVLLNDTIIGRIGIYKIDNQNKIGAIGYWLGGDHQGKGIMTKACKALINYCFSSFGLNRIEIKCGTKNYKSQSIPERLFLKKEGVIKEGELLYDEFIDLYSYAITKTEWQRVNETQNTDSVIRESF